MKKLFCHILSLLCLYAALSCSRKETAVEAGTGLILFPTVAGGSLTKAADPYLEEGQQEDVLNTLDIFIEGASAGNAGFWKEFHLSGELADGLAKPIADDWKGVLGYVPGYKYNVYVVANSTMTGESAGIASYSQLSTVRETEYSDAVVWDDGTINPAKLNLHKAYDPSADEYSRIFTPSKQFLMDGKVMGWEPSGNGRQIIPVDLKRAASKFLVDVSFSDTFVQSLADKGTTITGDPGWRFLNFAFDTPVLEPAAVTAAEHVLSAGALLLGSASYDPSDYHFRLRTYAYSDNWTGDQALMNAPAVLVSIGYTTAGNTTYHYYRIPIVDSKTTTQIDRNKIYKVHALISSEGANLLEALEGSAVNYQVVEWNEEGQTSISPTIVEQRENLFLHVTPRVYSMRGDGVQTVDLSYSIPKYSNIKVMYFTTAAAAETVKDGVLGETTYTASNMADYNMATNTSRIAFYYNRTGNFNNTFSGSRVPVTLTDSGASSSGNGKITITSTSLANKAVSYIIFRIYLDVADWQTKGLYRDVVWKHYPTDNIQGIEGLWSSRWFGDYYSDGKASTGTWVDWERDQTNHTPQKTVSGNHFTAKVYNGTYCRYIADNSSGGGYRAQMGTNQTSLTNNHMYVVQITRSSDDFILGAPVINETTKQSQDHVVSPAFMIASQLGAVTVFNEAAATAAANAAEHCATYMEVAEDGTRYVGWRLPTSEEISEIIKYQSQSYGNDNVMSEVLTGYYYWSLSGEAVVAYTSSDNTTKSYVRCIRDLTAEEVAALNRK